MTSSALDTDKVSNSLLTDVPSERFTLRLPATLLDWVRQQGGSSYVRQLLLEQRDNANKKPRQMRSLRSESSLAKQWELLTQERDLIALDRELLTDEEKVQDRREDKLDRERTLLDEKRDQLEDEWDELEQSQWEMESLAEALASALVQLSFFPGSLPSSEIHHRV